VDEDEVREGRRDEEREGRREEDEEREGRREEDEEREGRRVLPNRVKPLCSSPCAFSSCCLRSPTPRLILPSTVLFFTHTHTHTHTHTAVEGCVSECV